jgi:tetratricopeptide (TPR) repeat protein
MATTTMATTTSGTGATGQVTVGGTTVANEPDLSRPYTPPSNLPATVQAGDKQAVATAIAQLKIDPTHEAYWLQLAEYRKDANDFTGAEQIWVFCTKQFPADPIAYNNLADLYENYLHDYASATTYWNDLIKLSPTNISAYINLATMQDINLKDKASAQVTLQAGLKANPGNTDLQNALNNLQ